MQYVIINMSIEGEHNGFLSKSFPDHFWFDPFKKFGNKQTRLFDYEIEGDYTVSLADDLVITTPWNRNSMESALTHIGGFGDKWRQDKNHKIDFWLPQRIAYVRGGKHSIAAGIVKREGFIKAETVYDISLVYEEIYCDGIYFIETKNGGKISKVNDTAFAAIFEIGRLMI